MLFAAPSVLYCGCGSDDWRFAAGRGRGAEIGAKHRFCHVRNLSGFAPISSQGVTLLLPQRLNGIEMMALGCPLQSEEWMQSVCAEVLILHPSAEIHLPRKRLLSPSTPHGLGQGSFNVFLYDVEIVSQLALLLSRHEREKTDSKSSSTEPSEGTRSNSFQTKCCLRYTPSFISCRRNA